MNNGGNDIQNSLRELDEKMTGTLTVLRNKMLEIKNELDFVKKDDLYTIKNNVDTAEKRLTNLIEEKAKQLNNEIEKFKYRDKIDWKRIPVAVISLGISVIFSYLFLHFAWQMNRPLNDCDVVVFVSLIFGFVAIVITAVVMLTRRNSEE
ncbi:MAG: hypothetical protein NT166_11225 [Candidatus Aminicenantes bacterium]|nr:hypothetical protein [Candidatus Aminicenantes bacterium]